MLLNQVREQTNFFEQRAESQNWSKFKKYSDDDPRSTLLRQSRVDYEYCPRSCSWCGQWRCNRVVRTSSGVEGKWHNDHLSDNGEDAMHSAHLCGNCPKSKKIDLHSAPPPFYLLEQFDSICDRNKRLPDNDHNHLHLSNQQEILQHVLHSCNDTERQLIDNNKLIFLAYFL